MKVLFIGCSKRKKISSIAIPAIDLYQGNSIPHLRSLIRQTPPLLSNVFIISGKYGVIKSTQPIRWYDKRLTVKQALKWNSEVKKTLNRLLLKDINLDLNSEILIFAEFPYYLLLSCFLSQIDSSKVFWIKSGQWNQAESILDRWGWIKSG